MKGKSVMLQPDADEELHCLIQGETIEGVERAAAMIKKLLVIDESSEEHKKKQMLELALINGTLRDEYCIICGEKVSIFKFLNFYFLIIKIGS